MHKGREIAKTELEYCISQNWGENKAYRYLKVGPATYRRWMQFYGLKSIHSSFDNTKYHATMSLCEECKIRKCWKDKVCSKCKHIAHVRAIKTFLLNKLGGKCQHCNETDYNILEFHHINPTEKEYEICHGALRLKNITRYLQEIKKCIILCSNCHKKIHTKYFKHPRLQCHYLKELELLECLHK